MATIAENLQIIINSTLAMKQAIIDRGGTIDGDITTWANSITDIPSRESVSRIDNLLEEIIIGKNRINFTIKGTQYLAIEGMTWKEWVNSKYNIDGYYKGPLGEGFEGRPIYASIGNNITDQSDNPVYVTDIIINNYNYLIRMDKFLETPYTFTIMYRDIEAGTEDYHYEEKTLYRKNESDTLRDCLNYPINGATRIDNGYDMGDYILHDYAIDDKWGLVEFYKALPILHKDIYTSEQQMRLYTTSEIAPDGTDLNDGGDWSYYLQYETDSNMSWFDWLHSNYVDNSDFLVENVSFSSDSFAISCKVKSTGWSFTIFMYHQILESWTEGYWEVEVD